MPRGTDRERDLVVIHGWMNPEELAALQDLAREHQPVLEIGCYHGLSTSALAAVADVTVVDTFEGSPEMPEEDRAEILPQFIANMRAAGLMDRITIFVGRSQNVMPCLAKGTYGLVFIDGSHEYEDVLSDMRWAQSLLKPGGLVVFDDRQWDGVRDAADAVLPGWVPCTGKMGIWASR